MLRPSNMEDIKSIFGCFLSYPSLIYGASEEEEKEAKEQGDTFRSYIWSEKGICDTLKKLNHEDYGQDLKIILLQFYVNPVAYELEHLKEIESYRKKEKSIGIPIIINHNNFFCKSEQERLTFLAQSILKKLDVLGEVIRRKRMDTKIDLLKSNFQKILEN